MVQSALGRWWGPVTATPPLPPKPRREACSRPLRRRRRPEAPACPLMARKDSHSDPGPLLRPSRGGHARLNRPATPAGRTEPVHPGAPFQGPDRQPPRQHREARAAQPSRTAPPATPPRTLPEHAAAPASSPPPGQCPPGNGGGIRRLPPPRTPSLLRPPKPTPTLGSGPTWRMWGPSPCPSPVPCRRGRPSGPDLSA